MDSWYYFLQQCGSPQPDVPFLIASTLLAATACRLVDRKSLSVQIHVPESRAVNMCVCDCLTFGWAGRSSQSIRQGTRSAVSWYFLQSNDAEARQPREILLDRHATATASV
jgi:hypothetical protein